ncbi:hypothetical protein SH661x_004399 [Planctomicrobium sp. SH661]|uniref:hypothetical protein n=1 Tax=Planctomicrobium sp. SH661 TaxID=3448124 RepID=UPI003F5AE848
MSQQANSNRFHLGFLRVALTDHGYVGGFLVTNHFGRPLEFQCTTPVRPNRTQEILYGPTLEPFICSELIGKTLYERLGIKPQLIIVQQENLLELRRQIEVPTGCLIESPVATSNLPDQTLIQIGRQSLRLHSEFPEDLQTLAPLQSRIPADADMREPLERVADALKETLRAGAVA